MKAILIVSSLLIATPAFAQVAPNPATNGGPPATMPAMENTMPATDAPAPMPGMNPATNGPATAPAPAEAMAPPAADAAAPSTDMAKVPMCSRTVTDKCMQSGARHMRKHK